MPMSASVEPTDAVADTDTRITPPDDPFRWLWLAEAAAEHYGARSTLRRHIAEGRLATAQKIGRSWRVRKYDLDSLIVERAAEPSCQDVEAAVARIVASAPPLTDAQIRTLSAAFVDQLKQRQTVGAK